MSSSRLTRLLDMLGKGDATSHMAVAQLAAIAAQQRDRDESSEALRALLDALLPLTCSDKWDVRSVASDALAAVAAAASPVPIAATERIPVDRTVAAFDLAAALANEPLLLKAAAVTNATKAAAVATPTTAAVNTAGMSAAKARMALLNAKAAAKSAAAAPPPTTTTVAGNKRKDAPSEAAALESDVWPFLGVFVQLRSRLCDARWEWRHGAATALRALVGARCGDAALRQRGVCDDLLARVLLVLATDRFVDFQGDASVAPVRAAVATLVREIVSSLPVEALVTPTIDKLSALVAHTDWRVQQGGFLALKFICAASVRPTSAQLQRLLALAIPALRCSAEDVASEAAETLFVLADRLDAAQCGALLAAIWPLMQRHGRHDSSVAAGNLLRLLAEVVGVCAALPQRPPLGADVAALLWPFLLHNLAAVRMSALEALQGLVQFEPACVRSCAADALRFVFQALFFATHDAHALLALDVWRSVCAGNAGAVDATLLGVWLALVATPVGAPIDPALVRVPASATAVAGGSLRGDDDVQASDPIVLVAVTTAGAARFTRLLQCADALSAVLGDAATPALTHMLGSSAQRSVALLLLGSAPLELRSRFGAAADGWLAVRAFGDIAPSDADLDVLCRVFAAESERPWHRCAAQTLARLMASRGDAFLAQALAALSALLLPAAASEPVALLSRADAARRYDAADELAPGDADAVPSPVRCACVALAGFFATLADGGSGVLASALDVGARGAPAMVLLSAVASYAPEEVGWQNVAPQLSALGVRSVDSATQGVATAALARVCAATPRFAAQRFVEMVLGALHDGANADARLGGALCVRELLRCLDADAAPFVALLAPAMLTCMSDFDERVRDVSALCFAQLVRLMPIEAAAAANERAALWFSVAVLAQRESRRALVTQLLDGSSLVPYAIPAGVVRATLRPYQQHGVNWLAFLRQYGLHGILCDDMGLGKTLQTLCMLASDRWEHERFMADASAAALDDRQRLFGGGSERRIPPSIIVCPTTLQRHWANECEQFCGDVLRPLVLDGAPAERRRRLEALFGEQSAHNVVIVSYSQLAALRDDALLKRCQFRYAVLDEGHLIKNNDTQTAKACKQVRARYRLMLSGTPVQNNVLELWSLFDFLMPGFLGSKADFNARYEKPIQATRTGRAKPAQVAAATRALKALHQQVLPFVLRRLKGDVLKDLPPKILQDVECDSSELQALLLARLDRLAPPSEALARIAMERKICNHPSLALASHAMRAEVVAELAQRGAPPLDALEHSPKLVALLELLQSCGIGGGGDGDEAGGAAAHRVLIFALHRESLELIERLFRERLPACRYVRLDSCKTVAERQPLVTRFNRDPTIDVMLLLTEMGGLGLNLTGADTVVFFEHHFNPAQDDQASNRPHRIGQTRTVTVYRLITRDTIEQRVHSLQQFKRNIANAVVNADNSNIAVDLNTNQLLDLYERPAAASSGAAASNAAAGGSSVGGLGLDPARDAGDLAQLESEAQYEAFAVKRARGGGQ